MGSYYVVSSLSSVYNAVAQELTAGTSHSTLFNALENGGPAGLIYGYLFVWCGAILQALVMAEMASMYVFNTAFCCFGHFRLHFFATSRGLDMFPAPSTRLRLGSPWLWESFIRGQYNKGR